MRDREAGFSWTEMMVVVAIMGITAVAVLPVVGTAVSDSKAQAAGEQVLATLRLARQNAISAAGTYQVTFTADTMAVACTANCPATSLDFTEPLAPGTTLATTANPISFTPTGTATAAGTVTVSYPAATDWQVVVNLPGTVRMCKSTCS